MTEPPPLTVEVVHGAAGCHLVVAGELDMATVALLRLALLAQQAEPLLVLDLAAVSFCDSQGVDVLVDAHQTRAARGQRLVLRSVSRTVRRVLQVTGLLGLLELEDTPPTDPRPA